MHFQLLLDFSQLGVEGGLVFEVQEHHVVLGFDLVVFLLNPQVRAPPLVFFDLVAEVFLDIDGDIVVVVNQFVKAALLCFNRFSAQFDNGLF
mmetsp:Transcript_13223/g.11198  ORF Transcript_13223/g.11198 Transcript_13223/m.11198 type:complete len:92 (-) Transcript_13223:508-783(-)